MDKVGFQGYVVQLLIFNICQMIVYKMHVKHFFKGKCVLFPDADGDGQVFTAITP